MGVDRLLRLSGSGAPSAPRAPTSIPASPQNSTRGTRPCRVPPALRTLGGAAILLWAACSRMPSGDLSVPQDISFVLEVRPLLADRCFQCHGPDEGSRIAALRLDTRAGLFETRASGKVVVPGRPDESLLFQRITSEDPARVMPPGGADDGLSNDDIQTIRRWIESGAPWTDHWAFTPPQRRVVPAGVPEWGTNEIDAFIGDELVSHGLEPSPPADPARLLRRVTFDLTGLPPTIEALDAFTADPSETAYAAVVDELLASPRYGEHMAVQWLDIARYADTHGYHVDQERTAWPWRDWVVDALNRNVPYDEFAVAQIAGDMKPDATPNDRLATAFSRNHPISYEDGIVSEEYRVEYVADRVSTFASAWLGLTVACARCHDHKFDPIRQKDFYRLAACFDNIPEEGKGTDNRFAPTLAVKSPLQVAEANRIDRELASLSESAAELDEKQRNWENEVSTVGPAIWQTLVPDLVTAPIDLQVAPDGSVLAGGSSPETTVYELSMPVDAGSMSVLRLEALTDPSLPRSGPGRAGNGNFVLSELKIFIGAGQASIPIHSASSDYDQGGFPVAHAVDGDEKTGWAIGGGEGQDHSAVFVFDFPVELSAPGTLRVTMSFRHGGQHTLGRFRLSTSSDPDAASGIRALLSKPAESRTDEERQAIRAHYAKWHLTAEEQRVDDHIRFLTERKQMLADTPTSLVMEESQARKTFVLNRGAYDQPTEEVPCGVPAQIFPIPDGLPANRWGLAKWLVDPGHPLTARVAVNRFWQHFFGRGLVTTPEDFGTQGAFPTHPALLDWLAVEFIASGWDVKAFQRRIVLSSVYRQSVLHKETAPAIVPDSRWLSYFPPQRLTGEQIRDRALALSGLLVESFGGPGSFPYQPFGLWLEQNNLGGHSARYPQQQGLHLYRRSLYSFWKRTLPPPAMSIFDAPAREVTSAQRINSNTPIQALALLNDTQYIEAARVLAGLVLKDTQGTPERIADAFRRVMSRRPDTIETERLISLYDSTIAEFAEHPSAALQLLNVGHQKRDRSLPIEEHAAMTTIVRVLFNTGESISKG